MRASTSLLFGAGDRNLHMEPISIVVVEDHEAVRMVVREILVSRGYSVALCRDGVEALRKIGTHTGRLDLLVTDIVLPGMDGRQLSERARAIRADLRTLYMSGYSRTSLERFGLGSASAYLQKPFTPDELIGRVQHVLSASSIHADMGRVPPRFWEASCTTEPRLRQPASKAIGPS